LGDDGTAIIGGGLAGTGLAIGAIAAKGAITGAAAGPWGALIGAVVGLAVGGVVAAVNKDAQDDERKALADIAKLSQSERDRIFESAASKDREALKDALELNKIEFDTEIINALMENSTELKKVTDELALNNKLMEQNNAIAMKSYLDNELAGKAKELYNNSKY
jgi:arginyl-tRNA synthetase